jgi:hypothetical protein
MRNYRRYRRPRNQNNYPYDRDSNRRTGRRGLTIAPGTLKFLAIAVVFFVLAAILLRMTR